MSEDQFRKNSVNTPRPAHTPRSKKRAGKQEILNDIANFRADKIININFARQAQLKDASLPRAARQTSVNQRPFKGIATSKEDKPSSRGRVAMSMEFDYEANSLKMQNSYKRPVKRSLSESKPERTDDGDDFDYEEPLNFYGEREEIYLSPDDVNLAKKAPVGRFNLRPLVKQQRSLLLDK